MGQTQKEIEEKIKTIHKNLDLQDNVIEQMDRDIRENSKFSALENGKFWEQIQEVARQIELLKENDMPQFVAAKWVEHGKDFVVLEVYKKQQAELAKKISAL